MRRKHALIVPAWFLVVLLSMPFALAQRDKTQQNVEARPEPQNADSQKPGFNPYSEANLKFDILESQLQTLRKKMQLQAKRKSEQTKAWNEHYERVKQHIEAWDNFVDSYDLE
jgi:vacuolar-type H+-ATPase subunit I/STV1